MYLEASIKEEDPEERPKTRRKSKPSFQCDVCKEFFSQKQQLTSHLSSHFPKRHKKSPKIKLEVKENRAPPPKRVTCHICGKMFHRTSIAYHIQSHSDKKDFKCDQCCKSFHLERRLRAHQSRVHVEGRPFSCQICQRSYKTKVDLQCHMKYHDENRETYECPDCKLVFNYKNCYRRHLKLHSGAKPFQCDTCEKSFATKPNLKQHSYSHTGLRPHHCGICDKGKRLLG